ncbi:MAG: hypothetical protein R2875_13735 [Desulfobacterales bacterium]
MSAYRAAYVSGLRNGCRGSHDPVVSDFYHAAEIFRIYKNHKITLPFDAKNGMAKLLAGIANWPAKNPVRLQTVLPAGKSL